MKRIEIKMINGDIFEIATEVNKELTFSNILSGNKFFITFCNRRQRLVTINSRAISHVIIDKDYFKDDYDFVEQTAISYQAIFRVKQNPVKGCDLDE